MLEYWNGLNKDGDGANSNQIPVSSNPQLVWQKHLSDFPCGKNDKRECFGRRANNLCIRDNLVLVVTPEWDQSQPLYVANSPFQMSPTKVQLLSLQDGTVQTEYFAPIIGGSQLSTLDASNRILIQETDLRTGCVALYWGSDNIVHVHTGGDWAYTAAFKALTGEKVKETVPLNGGSNHSGYITMHNDAPRMYITGGADSHDSWGTSNTVAGWTYPWTKSWPLVCNAANPTIVSSTLDTVTFSPFVSVDDVLGSSFQVSAGPGSPYKGTVIGYDTTTGAVKIAPPLTVPLDKTSVAGVYSYQAYWNFFYVGKQKDYGASLMKGTMAYAYTCNHFPDKHEGYGYQVCRVDLADYKINPITGKKNIAPKALVKGVSTSHCYMNFGKSHCSGAPRAVCLTDNGKLCMFGFTAKGTPGTKIGVPSLDPQKPDYSKPFSLAVLNSTTLAQEANIPTDWTIGLNSWVGYEWMLATNLVPQIATISKYVVVFQPQQQRWGVQARIFCFDTELKQMLWSNTAPWRTYQTNCETQSISFGSTEQAVQMVIAGDKIVIAEPIVDTNLRIVFRIFDLVAGVQLTNKAIDCWKDGQLITDIDVGTLGLRELAVVDGKIVVLIDYKNRDKLIGTLLTKGATHQWLGVLA